MFSLIITIISIALVTALALATIYYGGSAFRQGGSAAAAAKFINEGQQLSGAAAILEANGTAFTSQTDLKNANALQSVIASYDVAVNTVDRAFVSPATVTTAICDKVNEKAGAVPASVAATQNYGCLPGGTADTGTMVFKY